MCLDFIRYDKKQIMNEDFLRCFVKLCDTIKSLKEMGGMASTLYGRFWEVCSKFRNNWSCKERQIWLSSKYSCILDLALACSIYFSRALKSRGHTVQKIIVISNKFPRTFDSIFLSYVIDAYWKCLKKWNWMNSFWVEFWVFLMNDTWFFARLKEKRKSLWWHWDLNPDHLGGSPEC